jgi:hypothetical protein
MKKLISLNWAKYCLFIAFLSFTQISKAQLSGSYTIDSSMVTAGTNYQTFTDAITALTTSGVNGAVTFNVKKGTYNEQVVIPSISGANSANTITFNGLGSTTILTASTSSSNYPVLSLDSASHITVSNLKIVVGGSTGWGVHFRNHADSITIDNCIIEAPATLGNFGLVTAGSTTSTSAVQPNGNHLYITNNTITGCERSIQFVGMTGPLTVPSKKVNYGNHVVISNNTITGFYTKGVIVNNYHHVNVKGNTIHTSLVSSNGAVSFWDAGDDVTFEGNDVYVASNKSNTRVVALAMAPPNGPAGDSTLPCMIKNNFIRYNGGNSTAPTGLLLKNKAYMKVYNNTIKMKNQGGAANCIWLDNNNARALDGIEIINNIMALDNSGSGQFIYTGSSAIASRFKGLVLHHNNYYAPNGYFNLKVPNGTGMSTFGTFAGYKANTKGWGAGALNVDPSFVGNNDLHATSAPMNDSAMVIAGITSDIDGDLRSVTHPDMGADEYTPPSCLVATGLGITNLVSTSADVYFTQSNTGSTFKIQYGAAGFTLGNGTYKNAVNDTVSITGLTAQTNYEVYVMEICSPTDSSTWAGPISFFTPCASISTFPYIENFEGATWVNGSSTYNTGDAIDPCWSRSPSSSANYRWGNRTGSTGSSGTGPANAYGGAGNYMYTEASRSTPTKANFTSPVFDLSTLTIPELSFQYHMYGSSMGTLMVWAWNGSSYDTIFTKVGAQGASWKEAIIDLSAYKNTVTHLVFHAKKGSSIGSDMAIDQLMIQEAPACPKVTSVSMSNPTATTATANFISGGTKFLIEYGPTGFVQGTGMNDTAYATGHVITGLASETVYDFYFQNDCIDSGNGTSVWVGPFSIKTRCAEVSGLYSNNWDHLANNATDFCWSFKKYGTGNPYARAYVPYSSYGLQPKSGTKIYRWYNVNNNESYLSSPGFTYLDSNNRQVRFWAGATYSSTKTPRLYVGTALSANDTASFTVVDTILPAKNTWNEYIIPLNNVPAGHKYVMLQNATTGSYVYIGIEDFNVEYIPACLPATSGSASNVTPNSAVLSWLAGSASTYTIEYGVSGFIQGTGVTKTITSLSDTLTGLSSQTCYDVYITGNCTNNNSPILGPITFCTPCNIITAPWTENFDSAPWAPGTGSYTNGDAMSPCWSRNPSANNTHKWAVRTGGTVSSSTGPAGDMSGAGNYLYTETSTSSTGHNAVVLTPEVDFSSLNQPTLSFSYHMYGATMGSLWVTVWDSIQYDTLWSIAGQQHTADSDPFTTVYIDLTPYKNTPRKIRIVGKRGTSYTGDMAIDEISIAEMPSCLMPNSFALDSVSSTFADFSWGSISGGTQFVMEYGPTGFGQGSGIGSVAYSSGTSTTVNNLNVNTTYDIYLADMCDSTQWVGPITFTTLIDHDIEVMSIVSPTNLDCGDSSYVVEVMVKNNGLVDATGVPINVDISNGTNANISTTYNTTIASGSTATINVGTFNSYNGGYMDVIAYSGLTNDQYTMNDTLSIDSVELISVMPQHMQTDTLCADDTTGLFVALPQTGISHNWYANVTDTVPMHIGDTLNATPGQTVYLDRSKNQSEMVFDGTSGSLYGVMYQIYVKNDIVFTGFDFENAWNGVMEPIAFYKQGKWRGHETTPSSWTPIDSAYIAGGVRFNWYTVNFGTPVQFNAGDTISLYIANKKPSKMIASSYAAVGTPVDSILAPYKSNADIDFFAGVGGAYFGANMVTNTTATCVSHTLHYSTVNVCGNNRVALTMGVNNDTAVANFTHVLDPNGADVTFDASSSNGHVYDWSFGDGTNASGTMVNHTYVNGTFTAQLVVTDTICGTIDSMQVVINANVGLQESLLGRTLNVYPNPNNGLFRMSFETEGVKDIKVDITDELGRVVFSKQLGKVSGQYKEDFDLRGEAQGMYIMRITVDGQTAYKKISVLR